MRERLVRSAQVTVVFGRDRTGGWAAVTLGTPGNLSTDWLEKALASRLALPVLLCSQTHLGFLGFCRRAGLRHYRIGAPHPRTANTSPLLNVDRVSATARHFRWWLLPFHGVATRYLQHYLTWHGFLDANSERELRALARLLLSTMCRSPVLPAE